MRKTAARCPAAGDTRDENDITGPSKARNYAGQRIGAIEVRIYFVRCRKGAMRRKAAIGTHMRRSTCPSGQGRYLLISMYNPSPPRSYRLHGAHFTLQIHANWKPRHHDSSIFCASPFLGPLLFDNTDSDSRDHCANERSTSHPSPSLHPHH